jgi:hypothetical protein
VGAGIDDWFDGANLSRPLIGNMATRDAEKLGTRTDFRACVPIRHPAIQISMYASSAAQMLTLCAVAKQVVPRHQFQHRLGWISLAGRSALIHGNPPVLRLAHHFATDIAPEALHPSHLDPPIEDFANLRPTTLAQIW